MSNTEKQFMIYGANGYTGELIAREAINQGLKPILAGRNQSAIEKLANELELSFRVFDLSFEKQIVEELQSVDSVIHCAGPFSATAEPMMKACIASKTHYTDITGEIGVFELAQSMSQQAKDAGIVLCPGVGFDVVPTDCLASLPVIQGLTVKYPILDWNYYIVTQEKFKHHFKVLDYLNYFLHIKDTRPSILTNFTFFVIYSISFLTPFMFCL